MKTLLKKLVLIPSVNSALRKAFRWFSKFSKWILRTSEMYIPFSGTFWLRFDDQDIGFYARGDDHFVTKTYYRGLVEKNELRLFSTLAKNSSGFLDIGANVGLYSLMAAKANSILNIHAFEADPFVFERLNKAVTLNKVSNVSCHHLAAGASDGPLKFFVPRIPRNTTTSSMVQGQLSVFYPEMEYDEIEVPQMTIDSFLNQNELAVDLIKLDVELAELEVLTGMKSTLKEQRPLIIAELFNGDIKASKSKQLAEQVPKGYSKRIEELLVNMGYEFILIGREGLLPVDTIRGSVDNHNYLLTPIKPSKRFYSWSDLSLLSSELRSSP